MDPINFSLIIPNLNGQKFLQDCLVSIKNTGYKNLEIILVDNASTDNSLTLAKQTFPKIKIIKNKTNLGFAAAINQGIQKATYDWVIPCNNDLKLSKNWFIITASAIKQYPNISTFFGTVKNYDGSKIESTGLKFFIKGKCLNIRKKIFQPKLIFGGNAALIIYKKSVLNQVGLFDSDFFAYEEDVDLALRLNNSGHQTLLVPSAVSYHLGGATSSKMGNFRHRMDTKNWIFIIIKNYSAKTILKNFFPILEERLRNLSGLLKNTPFFLWLPTTISVYGQVLIKLPNMLQKRWQNQNKI